MKYIQTYKNIVENLSGIGIKYLTSNPTSYFNYGEKKEKYFSINEINYLKQSVNKNTVVITSERYISKEKRDILPKDYILHSDHVCIKILYFNRGKYTSLNLTAFPKGDEYYIVGIMLLNNNEVLGDYEYSIFDVDGIDSLCELIDYSYNEFSKVKDSDINDIEKYIEELRNKFK